QRQNVPRAWSSFGETRIARDDDAGGTVRSGGRTQSRPENPRYSCAITPTATDRRGGNRARTRSTQRRRRISPTQRRQARARRPNGFGSLYSTRLPALAP